MWSLCRTRQERANSKAVVAPTRARCIAPVPHADHDARAAPPRRAAFCTDHKLPDKFLES